MQSDGRVRSGRPVLPDLSAAVMLAQAGDEEAFRALYRAVQPGLVRYLQAIVGEDAEDVASETWSQIARDLGSFHGDGDGFRGWAATVARHQALDHLRYLRRRPATTCEALPELPAFDDPEAAAIEIMSTQAAVALIATLPRDQAEAVLLRVVMGLDVETTGRVLEKSAGAVRVATHRGLRHLAERLDAARGADPDRRVPADRVTGRPMSDRNADDVPDAVADQMDSYRIPPIDAVTAERLVAGDRTDRERLADLLATAAGPTIPAELAGEQRAMSAFRRAQDAAVDERPGRSWTLARWLTVKAAALALAGTATGVALATATGVMPNPLDSPPQVRTGTAAPSNMDGTTPPAVGAGNATPAVTLIGLCAEYATAVDTEGDRTLDDPAFARLVEVARAREAVSAFCEALLRDSTDTADVDTGAPTDTSSGQGNPANPTVPPSPHPTGPPNPHPTGPPTKARPLAQGGPDVQVGPDAGAGSAQAGLNGSGSRSNAHGPRGADEGGAARRT